MGTSLQQHACALGCALTPIFQFFVSSNLVLNLLLGFFNNRPIAYIVEMENKTDKNGKNTSFVEILAVLRCDFTILFRALSFSLDFII